MSLRTRLRRLEQAVRPGVCPACGDREGRMVLVTVRQTPDGYVPAEGEALPAPCPNCARVPEQVIAVVECVVASRAEALGWQRMPAAGVAGSSPVLSDGA